MKKPNVLILMCDQMQAQRMGFVDGVAHTPTLDSLAKEGIHFTNAITIHGQCVPSRCSFATAKSPHETNVMVNFGFHGHCGTLTPSSHTFFHEFQEAGYTTALFGKSHMGPPLSDLGFDVGQRLDGNFPEGKEPMCRVKHRQEVAAAGGDGTFKSGGAHHGYIKDGLEWLNGYEPGDDPLLFMFNTNLPHPPFHWEEEWQNMFKPEDMVLPKSFSEETFDGKPPYIKDRSTGGSHAVESEDQVRTELAQYYTLIAAVDKACGQIIDVFKKKGIWDNTIVLFFTDHGDMMGGHRLRRKGCYPYEELYNIPCVIRLPKGMQRKRAVIEEPVSSIDLPAALLKLAGIDAPEQFTGGSVVGALDRDAPSGDEHVFFEHYAAWWGIHPFYGVRTATMKYVRYYGDEDTEEMYDLATDPDELHNIAFDPDYADRRKELSALVDNWWQSTNGKDAAFYASDMFKHGLNG